MPEPFNEETVERATLDWFRTLGYAVQHGPDIKSETLATEGGPETR